MTTPFSADRQRLSQPETASDVAINQSLQHSIAPQRASQRTLLQRLQHRWNNLSFRTKLTILLVGSAAIPVIVVTQGLVVINKSRALTDFTAALQGDGKAFTDEYVVWSLVDNQVQVKSLVTIAKATRINLNNLQEVAEGRALLNEALQIDNASNDFAETHKSFQLLTNAQGETVAQDVQELDLSAATSTAGQTPGNQTYRTVSLPANLDLGELPIVKAALSSAKPLAGLELLDRQQLQRLGLEQQARFGLPALASSESPPVGSSSPQLAESDRIGLVSIAVQPILVNNRVVGAAIAGSMLNNHNDIANQFAESYGVPICSVFAQAVQVMGSSSSASEMLRVPASPAAIETVLNQGNAFTGRAIIQGKPYLTHYEPLYDHQRALNPEAAKPVGMVLVAKPLDAAETDLRQQQLISYSIGGSMWLLALLLAFPVAASFSQPLRRLTEFAGEVAVGRSRQRLDDPDVTGRQDEIGILAQELNQMVDSLAANEAQLRQESQQSRLGAEITGARTSSESELAAVFDRAVQEARALLKADRVILYRFNPDGSGYVAAESVAPGFPAAEQTLHLPASLLPIYQSGEAVPSRDIAQADLPTDYLRQLQDLQTKANLVAPILNGDRLLAVFMVDNCTMFHSWSTSEVEFCRQLAAQLGLVIDRFTLLKETENLAEEQRQRKEELQARVLQLLQEVEPISRGDLTIQTQVTEDEIGTIAEAYNSTVGSLQKIVMQVQLAAGQVTEAATRNENSIQELSTEALRQAAEIATALERVEAMANAVQAIAKSANQAEAAMQRTTHTVAAGDAAMNQTVSGMQSIQFTVAETADKVQHLEEASQKIATVVDLIKSFAQQTNMLALSASIEASRASDENREFLVIAREVQSLAQRSAQASDEIKQAVEHMQSGINEVVVAMKAGMAEVASGTELVAATRQSLNKITEASAEIGELVGTIAQATVVQSQASETVTRIMQDVTLLAHKTSVEVGQVSASFQQLRRVAQLLQDDVGQFKVG